MTANTILRKYVRELLTEAAANESSLEQADAYIAIEDDGDIDIFYADADGHERAMGVNPPFGSITIMKPDEKSGPCGDAYTILFSEASKGWGPMLYDIAIEIATMRGGGLTPDRGTVSPQAMNVWGYYDANRSDVTSHQLDATDRDVKFGKIQKLTPDVVTDDCSQRSAMKDAKVQTDDKQNWSSSPLSRRYTKSPSTIQALRFAGRLIEK